MQKREVVVAGGGPAGATVALVLAQRGRDVLVVERKRFPRPKACGDGISASALSGYTISA